MNVIDRIKLRTTPEQKAFVQKNLIIVNQITELINEKGWSQKEFAQKLGKHESEVSKWLTGMHNISLKSIAKMETLLDRDIITTPLEAYRKYKAIDYITLTVNASINNSALYYLCNTVNEQPAKYSKTNISMVS